MKSDGGTPFDPKLMLLLGGGGILAFLLFLVFAAYAPPMGSGRDGRAHAMSVSAIGFAGIVKLLRLDGIETRLARSDAEWDTEDLLVVAVEMHSKPEAIEALVNRRGARATLIVLPKWLAAPDPAKPAWVRAIGPASAQEIVRKLGFAPGVRLHQGRARAVHAVGTGILDGVEAPLPPGVQSVSGPTITPLLAAPDGRALVARVGEGALYLLADPDLIANHRMDDADAAGFALDLMHMLNATDAQGVAFDVSLNGFGAGPNILRLAFEPPFLALTIALVAAILLAALHGTARFGPVARRARAIAFGKAALAENAAGLFRIARREHRAGAPYAEMIRDDAARAEGAGDLKGEALDAALDRYSPPGAPAFTTLAARAATASDPAETLAAARALFHWKRKLIR